MNFHLIKFIFEDGHMGSNKFKILTHYLILSALSLGLVACGGDTPADPNSSQENNAPVISGTPSTSVNENTAYSFTPTASDIDADDSLTFNITGKPSWANFNTTSGALTGTPSHADIGTTSDIIITVTDDGTGNLSDSLAAFSIEVVDNVAPTSNFTFPVNNATNTVMDAIVSITFNEVMNTDSFTGNFTLDCGGPISGTVSNTGAGTIATFDPTSNLPSATSCTATVTSGVQDPSGNAFAGTSWSFTTGSEIIRVSVASDGTEGDGSSTDASISGDGRYIAFQSSATNLVSVDANAVMDVFVHDTLTGATTRESVTTSGTEGTAASSDPSINGDGLYVAFQSSSNFVTTDTNGSADIFLREKEFGITSRVSLDSNGIEGNGSSAYPSMSNGSNGGRVAFSSFADNLVADDMNGHEDVFVRTSVTTRASVSTGGTEGISRSYRPSVSADGRVVYTSGASNLVADDNNGQWDIFVHNTSGGTTRVSVASDGTEGNGESGWYPAISTDGRYVAFQSSATNLVADDNNARIDIFVHDTLTSTTSRVSVDSNGIEGNGHSWNLSISTDGRYVAFASDATNLVTGDTNGDRDIFVHEMQTGVTTRVNIAFDGMQANNFSWEPSISADGQYVAFHSIATNLISGDTNGVTDVFRVINPLYTAP